MYFCRGTCPAQLQCVLLLCMSRAVASMCHVVSPTFHIRYTMLSYSTDSEIKHVLLLLFRYVSCKVVHTRRWYMGSKQGRV